MFGICLCLAFIDDESDIYAFESLVRKYEKKLFTAANKILASPALAEDAVWETFFRVAQNLSKIRECNEYELEAYLYMTVKSSALKIYRREKNYRENNCFINLYDIPAAEEYDSFEISELKFAIRDLDDKYKTVITYYYYYQTDVDEIAQLMGVSRRTVYNYLKEANRQLKEMLGGEEDEPKHSSLQGDRE